MRVVFRADASIQIGTGHLMRCLTLADELVRQGHECEFICRNHVGHLGELISSKGFRLTMLAAVSTEMEPLDNEKTDYAGWLEVPWQQDAEQTLAVLASLNADWLVVDHYALDARWERQVSSAVGQIMVIDDLADRHHACAVLLDQNLGRAESDYEGLVRNDCIRLIGPEYALLRPEFAQFRQRSLKRREDPEVKRILISLGGVDQTNVTGQVLAALAEMALPEETCLDIIMGASAPYLDEVQQQAVHLPYKAMVNVGVRDMAERMSMADVSIGAAGSTSWERCCLGLPAITIVLANNQRLIGEALAEANAALLIEESQIAGHLGSLLNHFVDSAKERHNYSRNAAAVCDGGGTTRVASMMSEVSQA